MGAGPKNLIFVIRVHGCIHHINLVRIRDTFAVVRPLFGLLKERVLKQESTIGGDRGTTTARSNMQNGAMLKEGQDTSPTAMKSNGKGPGSTADQKISTLSHIRGDRNTRMKVKISEK